VARHFPNRVTLVQTLPCRPFPSHHHHARPLVATATTAAVVDHNNATTSTPLTLPPQAHDDNNQFEDDDDDVGSASASTSTSRPGNGCPQVSCPPRCPPLPTSLRIHSPTTCHVTVAACRRCHQQQRTPSTLLCATSPTTMPPLPPSRVPRHQRR